ncbi:DnaJ, subfamily C [Sarocladium implicatum]|nr:DnaJ, subfamily C [Sarocladium implicatum]
MTRRLEEATEDALLTGGRAGHRAIQDAGFSDELKEKLFDKISEAKFRKQYAGAFATASMPSSAGEGTQVMAGGQPWTGTESTEDSVLRMLDDARKPLKPGQRGKFKPPPVDMRLKKAPKMNTGQRIASVREKAMEYSSTEAKSSGMSNEEREEYRKELRERFAPSARAMPNSITGLAGLANERIEDAIARGQFKDIPRGKDVKRDTRADNPFINTTEYIMNKMIQRQDIVPPWIEKQQDLVKAAAAFRARLRNDWKRHAARMIASEGGSLVEQLAKAEAYAAAERVHNPRKRVVDQIPVPSNLTDDPVMVKMREQAAEANAATAAEAIISSDEVQAAATTLPRPYRDPTWEAAELKYLTLSIDTLNATTRSYNLQAPDLAKKPCFTLQRELDACYADVAPLIAEELRERALGPRAKPKVAKGGVYEKEGVGLWEHLGGKEDVMKIHLEGRDKAYGLKEWWRDVWKTLK